MPSAIETAEDSRQQPLGRAGGKQQISATSADFAKSREALEQQLGDRVRASPHFAEGVAAFREKRRPDYS